MFDDPLLEDPVLDDRSSWSSLSRKDSSGVLVSAVHQAPLLEERPRHTSFKSSRKQSNDVAQVSSFKSSRKQSTDSFCGTNSKSSRKPANDSTRHRTRTSTADSHHEARRQVKVSDHRLAELACHAASTIEWDTLRARSSVWDKKKNLGDFGIYTRRCGRSHQIMASGSVACSITEMQHILCTTTTARYAAAMSELHGPSFLAGAVVHKINTRLLSDDPGRDDDDDDDDSNNNVADDMAASTTASRAGDGCYNLTVKTATFAKAHMFARNEHWCFLDFFQPQSDKQKFILSMHSLHPEDVLLPNVGANASSTSKHSDTTPQAPTKLLQEVSTGYSVVADPRRKLVWVVFFAQFLEPATTGGGGGFFAKRERASKHAVMKRLMKMAKASCYLPMIVHRRRLGVQVLADQNAFTPSNTHCIVCTAAVLGLASKQRCNLCGYCVCDKCSNKHEVERAHTHLLPVSQRPSVCVCLTCARRVDGANYDGILTGAASPSAVKRNAPNTAAPNVTLAGLLRDSFENAENEHKKRAVIQVIKSLLDDGSDEDSNNNDGYDDKNSSNYDSVDAYNNNSSDCDTVSVSASLSRSHTTRSSSSDLALVDALATNLHVRAFELDECELGNATSRNYPLTFSDERDIDSAAFPVPANEDARLAHVRKRRLSDIKNVPELEIICSIARKEMGCATGLVTIIEQDEAHVVASSSAMFQNVVVPRDQSMCAHAVLSDKPLLVPHADADVRFNRIGAVQNGVFSYYVGFPLVMSDNSVIGTVCCLDSDDREVTQAQYSIMTKLAATAARVMEMRANAIADAAANE